MDRQPDSPENRSTRSVSLVHASKKNALAMVRQRLSTKPAKADVLKILVRLSAIYGSPRDRPEHLIEVMAAEWLRAFEALPLEALNDAVGNAIRSLKFWPTPAELIALAGDHLAELRAQADHASLVAHERPSLQLTRSLGDDPETPVAMSEPADAAITEACANWRRAFSEGETQAERMAHWQPPSKAGASDALKQSRLVRGEVIP